MKPRISVITLGVDDLERALRFYRDGLGLPTAGIIGAEFEHGAVVFFDLQAGLKLALWPRRSLAHDSGIARTAPCATELSLGHNLASRAEVDATMRQVQAAGAIPVSWARLRRGHSASLRPACKSKKATAPCSNSRPMMPSVGRPRPSR